MTSLFVTCDDCGLSEGINHASLSLYQRGMASSMSVMANFPSTAHALDLFRGLPALDVGVHLNLTDGRPLARLPASSPLVLPDGRFADAPHLFRHALLPSAAFLAHVATELTAQVEALVQAGVAPQHLSTHLHFHTLPSLRRIVLRLAAQYRVPWVRPWRLRATAVSANPLLNSNLGHLSAAAPDYITVLGHWLRRPPADFARALFGLHGRVELVIHPASPDDPTFPAGVGFLPHERLPETLYLNRAWPLISPLATAQPS
jgi:predicted glycoside hydrolase/deacetylase ChbG (UPF0249 family)